MLCIATRLHLSHHEVVFLGYCLNNTFLLSISRAFIFDCFQIKFESSLSFLMSAHSLLISISQCERLSKMIRSTIYLKLLLNCQSNMIEINIAICVIQIDFSWAYFMRLKRISCKHSFNSWSALIHTAPCCYLMLILLFYCYLNLRHYFSKNQNLFVLHHASMMSMQ